MQIVVNIDEKIYKALHPTNPVTFRRQQIEDMFLEMSCAIRNGKVLPKGHGRLIDADKLEDAMYHEAFETDTDMQKWDSGCWIRYKMFENAMGAADTIVGKEVDE